MGVDSIHQQRDSVVCLPGCFPGGANAEEREEDAVDREGQEALEEDGAGDGCEKTDDDGQAAVPIANGLAGPEGLFRVAEALGDFGEGVACAGISLPVLAPSRDGEIVHGHGAVDVQDIEAERNDTAA